MLARMLLAPWLLFASMLLVEEKCCWDEPEGYQAPGWKRWLARRAKKGKYREAERRERRRERERERERERLSA